MNDLFVRNLILNFLNEDLGISGDWSSLPLKGRRLKAEVIAKEDLILCGSPFFNGVFELLGGAPEFHWNFEEGDEVPKGSILCRLECEASCLLSGERTALNLLQRLSGVATNTKEFVNLLRGSSVKLLDTRKTTPGLRVLEKYATKVGGALNHRWGLFDAVMLKDNHLKAFGGVKEAVLSVKRAIPATAKVEVEVENFNELKELLEVIDLVDLIMLDNWELGKVPRAVELIRERSSFVKVELSGGVDKESLSFIRELPIDFVSTSKLITSAKWVDVSLEVIC
ncbi:carboxylating nicotinate-nucleotide diphosphorylase [Thermovibrio sp.]